MNANRFFTVPFDCRNDTKMLRLGKLQRGKMRAFGRWMSLLGMLYDDDGIIDVSNDTTFSIVMDELEFRQPGDLEVFLNNCSEVGLIDSELWVTMQHVVNPGVTKQLAYRTAQSSNGKSGGRGKRRVNESETESEL